MKPKLEKPISTRVTLEEYEKIEAFCDKYNKNVADILRDAILRLINIDL